jgi:hypothetical protein
MSFRKVIPILGFILLIAACGGQSVDIRPITDIVISGPEFTNVGPITATLLVDTSIPVACSVVYGTTSEYGQIAVDNDMAGGGHENHHPLLTGLEPDTLYYARLQGTGADGTIYRSEEYTFHTTAQVESSSAPNLALAQNGAQIAGVSSNFGGGGNDSSFGALNAIDGNPATEWSSDGDGDDAWIEIELAEQTHVTRVGVWTRTMGSSAQIESFQVVTGEGETFGPFDLSDADGPHYFEMAVETRALRFEVLSSSGGNTGTVEIEVYG